MFIIFFIFLTTVFATSYEKYIDLLPEEEKQEFLDHVARRIMENVASKEDTNKFSRELSDDQLKEHNEFVQSILKQESLQMRRNKDNRDINEDEKKSEENLEVKPLQFDSYSNNDKIDNIDIDRVDLTINDIKRRSYDGTFKENTADGIDVDNSTDTVQPMQKRSIETEGDSSTGESKTVKTEKVEPTTRLPDLTIKNSSYTHSTTYKPSSKYKDWTAKPKDGLSKESDTDVSLENVVPLEVKESTTRGIERSFTTDTTTTTKSENVTETPTSTGLPKHKPTDSNITYILPGKKNVIISPEPVKVAKNSAEPSDSSNSSESDDDYTTPVYNKEQLINNSTVTSIFSDEGTTENVKQTTSYETTIEPTTVEPEDSDETSKLPLVSETTTVSELSNDTETTTTSELSTESETSSVSSTVSTVSDISVTLKPENVTQATTELYAAATEVFRAHEDSTTARYNITTAITINETSTTSSVTETSTESTATTTLPVPALTPTSILEQTTKKPKKIKLKYAKDKKSGLLSKVAGDALNKLKDKYKKKKEEVQGDEEFVRFQEVQKQFYKHVLEDSECNYATCKGYRVFEVHWPVSSESDDKPALRDSDPTMDQPLFVPLYNYAPENVYYNPQNRLGPNLVEENSIEVNMLRTANKDENEVPGQPEFVIDLELDLMRKFGLYTHYPKQYHVATHPPTKPPGKKKKKTTTTTEAPSEEQAVTKFIISFPNSDEDMHPYNSMKKGSMKNQIRLIRNVLFHNQQLPDVHEPDYEEFLYGKNTKGKKKHKTKKLRTLRNKPRHRNNIAIDYYFARSNQEKTKEFTQRSTNDVKLFFVNLFGRGGSGAKHKTSNGNKHHESQKDDDEPYDDNKNKDKHHSDKHSKKHHDDDVEKRISYKRKSKKGNKTEDDGKLDTISKILSLTPTNELFLNLKKMQDMNMTLMRRNSDRRFGTYIGVLREMLIRDDNALRQYNWLGTAVQIQSSLAKILALIDAIRLAKPIHPSDAEILKYVVFLHNFATEIKKASNIGGHLRNNVLLPRNNNVHDKYIKEKGLFNRVWLYLRTLLPDLTAKDELTNLGGFILNVEDGLFDLHLALKNIAKITKYKNQHWYENLKDLYLTSEEKEVKAVLLHISTARLVELIEYSCQNGLEDDFVEFMKNNKKLAKRTLEEMLFVSKIVDEINDSSL